MRFILTIILSISYLASCTRQVPPEQMKLTETNLHGINFYAKKSFTVDTPNAGSIAFYTLRATNVPPRKEFLIQSTDSLHVPKSSVIKLISDDEGRLWIKKDKVPLDSYPLPVGGVLSGETSSFWLVSQDASTAIITRLIAYPLETFGSDGAEVSVARLTRNGSQIECKGKFFNPNEVIRLTTSSKHKKFTCLITCSEGSFSRCFERCEDPTNFGDIVTVQIERENKEILSLQFPYGRESFNRDLIHANLTKLQQEDYEMIAKAMEKYLSPSIKDEIT